MSFRRFLEWQFPAIKQKTSLLPEKPQGIPVGVTFEYCKYHIDLSFDKRMVSWRRVISPKDGGRRYPEDYFDAKTSILDKKNIDDLYVLLSETTDMMFQKNTGERFLTPLPHGAVSDTIIHVAFEKGSIHYKNVWVDKDKKPYSIKRESVPSCIIRLFDYLFTTVISPVEEYYRKRSEAGYDLYFIVAEVNTHGLYEMMNGYLLDGNMYVHRADNLFFSGYDKSFQFKIENYSDESCTIVVFAYNPYTTALLGDLDSFGRKITVPYNTPIHVKTSGGFAGVLGEYVIMIAKDTKVLMSGLQKALGYDSSSCWDNENYKKTMEKCPIKIDFA